MALRTRSWINEGSFTPQLPSAVSEGAVFEQHLPVSEGPRHVVRHVTGLWLAATVVDSIQCVARVVDEDRRCQNRVLSDQADDGRWVQTEISAGPGRAGQRAFWDGDGIWIWQLDPLHADGVARWQSQRCTSHWPGTTPDAVPAEWVHLEPVWHSEHFVRVRPPDPRKLARSGGALLDMVSTGPKRVICATPDCRNGTVVLVEEGWLCYRCERRAKKRERTHRNHRQAPPEPPT